MKNNLQQSVIAITGAGSGIGQCLALECVKRGAHVAICDIDFEAVQLTADTLQAHYPHSQVNAQQLDVADRVAVIKWAETVGSHFGEINVIINNAGVALSASVESMQIDDFEWLMKINFWGVVHGCQAFLPYLKKSSWGHIVNVSSLFGLISTPNNSAYNAAKFAVRGFTESLRIELMMSDKRIGVSCVHPGGIKTNIVNFSREGGDLIGVAARMSEDERKQNFNDKMAKTSAAQAAKIIVDGIVKKRPRILVGADAIMLDILQRFLPVKYQNVVARVFR
jgi:NAD(P)-dependent dehydrogenase (short-subunit alcohol dehydrogenase family)